MARNGDYNEVIIKINKAVSTPDKDWYILSKFQSRWSGTKVENEPIQFNQDSIFGLIFCNEETRTSMVKFHLHGIGVGFNICTPMDKDLEILPTHEVMGKLMYYNQDHNNSANNKSV